MSTIARNATCPCGSGKKYKRCCALAEIGTAPPSVADFSSELRTRAFDRLVEFAGNRRFAPVVQAAYDEFWSEEFGRRSDAERSSAFARDEAEAGFITYVLLDAASADGVTIAEIFLAQPGTHLAKREREYLERLAGTRMGLFEVAAVDRDSGLTLLDLWSGERIAVREKLLTHDVSPQKVVAVRTFPAPDGATELDGSVYGVSRPHAEKMLAMLRAEWKGSRKKQPSLSQELFLKRRAAALINRYWFDNVFFSSLESSEPLDAGAVAVTFREKDLMNVKGLDELGDFLGSSSAPDAMDLSWLDGFLCAITAGPVRVMPSTWLPLVWGDVDPQFESQEQAERIIGLIFQLANHVADTIESGTHVPILFQSAPDYLENVAQGWCAGFAQGVGLHIAAWEPLINDERHHVMLVPILALGAPGEFIDDPSPDLEQFESFESMLPATLQMVTVYWRRNATSQPTTTRASGRTRRASTSPTASTVRASTVHRLKITLAGVKPTVWRRIEIASDAKLPFVSRALLMSMGWTDMHLHAFEVGRVRYGVLDPEFPSGMRSERSVALAEIAPNPKDRFWFDYDFGDGWRHRVTVEDIFEASGSDLPRCTAGARACPPEDCGGPHGYAELLEILADPTHDEHEEMLEWAGQEFDPAMFDATETNLALRSLVRGRRSKRMDRA